VGIAAVIALPTLLIVLAWVGIEALVRRARRRKVSAAGRNSQGLRTRRSEAARPRQPEGPPAAEDPSEL
jgi:ABC-type Fe3+ transport system permease subunit